MKVGTFFAGKFRVNFDYYQLRKKHNTRIGQMSNEPLRDNHPQYSYTVHYFKMIANKKEFQYSLDFNRVQF